MLLLASCTFKEVETVVIRGSDTEVNLVLQLAEEFMKKHENVSIAVTGGGSGTGIASLLNKKTDIANSSRPFFTEELQLASEKGVDIVPIVFAVDAICFIVHEDNPLDSIRLEDIQSVYSGTIKNWHQLTSDQLNKPISLYGRQSNSGTYVYIRSEILKQDYSPDMMQMNGNSQIVEGIKQDVGSIGYTGLGYVMDKSGAIADGLKVLSVYNESLGKSIDPTFTRNILNGSYPLIRPLYQYTDGKPEGSTKKFIEFELSQKGQQMISNGGYFPVPDKYSAINKSALHEPISH